MRQQSKMIVATLLVAFGVWNPEAHPQETNEPQEASARRELVLSLTLPERPDPSESVSLRLEIRNASDKPISLNTPAPLPADGKATGEGGTTLDLWLQNAKRTVSLYQPRLTAESTEETRAEAGKIPLGPGESWSSVYSLGQFHFWGPIGPAKSVEDCLADGSPNRFTRVAVRLLTDTGATYRSNFVRLDHSLPAWVFSLKASYHSLESVDDQFRKLRAVYGRDRDDLRERLSSRSPAPGDIPGKLNSPRLDERISAAAAILRLPEDRRRESAETLVTVLVAYLENVTDSRDQLAGILGLRPFDRSRLQKAENVVEKSLESEHFLLRAAARKTLERVRGEPIPVDVAMETYGGKTAGEWVAELAQPVEATPRPGTFTAREFELMTRLVRMGRLAVPGLVKRLGSENPRAATKCVYVLRRLYVEGEMTTRVLEKASSAPEPRVRRRALRVASYSDVMLYGSEETREASVRVLANLSRDDDPAIRREAVVLLSKERYAERAVVASHLVAALDDPEITVRFEAAKSLSRVKTPTADVLRALRQAAEGPALRLRAAARVSLVALGQDPASVGLLSHAARVGHENALQAGSIPRVPMAEVKIPAPHASVIVFVIDRSPSWRSGVQFKRQSIPAMLESLGNDIEFGIVMFDAGVRQFPKGNTPVAANPENVAAAIRFLREAGLGGGSCPMAGYKQALEFVRNSKSSRKAIVYVGDGGSTCPGGGHAFYREEFLATVRQENDLGCELHALGVGHGRVAGEDWLHYLASVSGGTYRRVVVPAARKSSRK